MGTLWKMVLLIAGAAVVVGLIRLVWYKVTEREPFANHGMTEPATTAAEPATPATAREPMAGADTEPVARSSDLLDGPPDRSRPDDHASVGGEGEGPDTDVGNNEPAPGSGWYRPNSGWYSNTSDPQRHGGT